MKWFQKTIDITKEVVAEYNRVYPWPELTHKPPSSRVAFALNRAAFAGLNLPLFSSLVANSLALPKKLTEASRRGREAT